MKIKLVNPHKMFRAGLHYYFILNLNIECRDKIKNLMVSSQSLHFAFPKIAPQSRLKKVNY